jgi:aldose 1-epimerase
MSNLKHRFQVIEEKFGAYSSYKLTDSETGEYATILPYLGGTINNLALKHNSQLVEIIDGYQSPEDVEKNLTTTFKGSNLFPFPNRISGGKYNHLGKDYQLDINFPNENNAIHGLVFDKKFEIISKEDGDINCSLVILYGPVNLPEGYPFKYTLEVEYRWIKYALFECISKVTNHSISEIPVGIGWHPYFTAGTKLIDDIWIQFPSESMLEVDNRMIPTGNSKGFEDFNQLSQLSTTKFDSCFVLKQDPTPAEIVIFNKKDNFGYKIWQETGENKYNFLQVYTPPARQTIAIEPMTCQPDAFNNKNGLINLAPGKSLSVKWGVNSIN